MPYILVSDFKHGMDRSRQQTAGIPGSLWNAKNCFISRGGDVVRAKKFVSTYSLPANTFGLAAVQDQLYVFGSASAPTMPVGVQYQRLQSGSANMTRVLDAKVFDNALYVIAEFDDGGVYHFYDGAKVTDWDTLGGNNSSFAQVAETLALKVSANAAVTARAVGNKVIITAKTAGTAFTCVGAVTDNGSGSTPAATATELVANVAGVAEVQATGTVQITGGQSDPGIDRISSVTVNGTELLAAAVNWVSSNSATANALAIAINNNTSTSGYTATAAGDTVTIKAAVGTGATPNGYAVVSTVHGTVTKIDTNMSGGVTAVTAVAQIYEVEIGSGTFDAEDLWKITINGTDYQTTGTAAAVGTAAFISKKRVWSPSGGLFRGCVLEDPTDWTTTTDPSDDSIFLNLANEAEAAQRLVGAGKYQNYAAIFARDVVLIYAFFADATGIGIVDILTETGSRSPRSIVTYGNVDVYYLDESGIRSIRARDDGFDTASVSDIGEPIDSFVQDWMATQDDDTLSRAVGAVDPAEGRYLLAIGNRIFALSFYPSKGIRAWSYVDPGFTVEDLIRAKRRIYARSGDTIYLYGGANDDTYPDADEQDVVVETPFLSAKDAASFKDAEWFDMAGTNDWTVELLVDPNDTTKAIDAGIISKVTYNLPSARLPGHGALLAFRFTCSAAGDATLSNFALGYDKIPAH